MRLSRFPHKVRWISSHIPVDKSNTIRCVPTRQVNTDLRGMVANVTMVHDVRSCKFGGARQMLETQSKYQQGNEISRCDVSTIAVNAAVFEDDLWHALSRCEQYNYTCTVSTLPQELDSKSLIRIDEPGAEFWSARTMQWDYRTEKRTCPFISLDCIFFFAGCNIISVNIRWSC